MLRSLTSLAMTVVVVVVDCGTQRTMEDDDFGEGDNDEMYAADMRKMVSKLGNDGFRIGKAQEEEKLMQSGFDDGFVEGIMLGRACGNLYGACAAFAGGAGSPPTQSLVELQVLLYETVPELETIDNELREVIKDKVLVISPELMVDWLNFEDYLKGIVS
jgi:hypothetical protein